MCVCVRERECKSVSLCKKKREEDKSERIERKENEGEREKRERTIEREKEGEREEKMR